jgi:uncharacterized protein YjdB
MAKLEYSHKNLNNNQSKMNHMKKSFTSLITLLLSVAILGQIDLYASAEKKSEATNFKGIDLSGSPLESKLFNAAQSGTAAILFLVDDETNLNASDTRIVELMEKTGYTVTVKTGENSVVEDTLAQDVVVISSTLSSSTVRDKFKWIEKPILVWENGAYDDFGMTDTDRGTSNIDPGAIDLLNDSHPITTGLQPGEILIGDPGSYTHGTPYLAESNSADLLATLNSKGSDIGAWFIYEVGDSLDPGTSSEGGFPADGLAVGMRIGLPFEDNTFANATAEAATILLNSIDYAIDGAIESDIPVTDVFIGGEDTLRLYTDMNVTAGAVVYPSNATNSAINYLSRNDAFVSYVDGVVTAVAAGNTYILASAADVSDSVYVMVTDSVNVTGVSVSPESETLNPDQVVQLVVTVEPDDATDPSVVFTSGDESVATVDETGLVTAVGPGSTIITVTTNDGGMTATMDISVNRAVTGVSLDVESASIDVDGTLQLTATIEPDDATDKSVTWSSSDDDIATVDDNGLVTAVSAGTAKITVITHSGFRTATAEITVIAPDVPVTGVTLNVETLDLEINSSLRLFASVVPEDATDQSVTWSSSDTEIVSVDNVGVITAVSLGTATVTATTTDGNHTASAEVTVSPGTFTGSLSSEEFNYYPNPVENVLMVEGRDIVSIKILDITGKLVLQKKENFENGINVSMLENGLYLIKVSTSEATATRRLIKK